MARFLSRILLALALLSGVLAVFFHSKIAERNRLLDDLIATETHHGAIRERDSVAAALATGIYRRTLSTVPPSRLAFYERWLSLSFFNMGTRTSLKYGAFAIDGDPRGGPCGTMSRTLLNALWRMRIPARKLVLLNDLEDTDQHTMVEYESNGRWAVISPSDSGYVWRNAAGLPATLGEIQSDPAVFGQIYARNPQWPWRFDYATHIRWQKLPGPAQRVLRTVLGARRYATAETPQLYDQPLSLLYRMSLSSTVFFLLLAWPVRRRAARRERQLIAEPVLAS